MFFYSRENKHLFLFFVSAEAKQSPILKKAALCDRVHHV